MANPQDNLQGLYNVLKGKYTNDDFETFSQHIAVESKRKKLYDLINKHDADRIKLGSWENFNSKLGFSNQPTEAAPAPQTESVTTEAPVAAQTPAPVSPATSAVSAVANNAAAESKPAQPATKPLVLMDSANAEQTASPAAPANITGNGWGKGAQYLSGNNANVPLTNDAVEEERKAYEAMTPEERVARDKEQTEAYQQAGKSHSELTELINSGSAANGVAQEAYDAFVAKYGEDASEWANQKIGAYNQKREALDAKVAQFNSAYTEDWTKQRHTAAEYEQFQNELNAIRTETEALQKESDAINTELSEMQKESERISALYGTHTLAMNTIVNETREYSANGNGWTMSQEAELAEKKSAYEKSIVEALKDVKDTDERKDIAAQNKTSQAYRDYIDAVKSLTGYEDEKEALKKFEEYQNDMAIKQLEKQTSDLEAMTTKSHDVVMNYASTLGGLHAFFYSNPDKNARIKEAERYLEIAKSRNDEKGVAFAEKLIEGLKNGTFDMDIEGAREFSKGNPNASLSQFDRAFQEVSREYNKVVSDRMNVFAAQHILDKAKDRISKHNMAKGQRDDAWYEYMSDVTINNTVAFKDAVFKLSTWDFGITDMMVAEQLQNVVNKTDNGEELTADESALLEAAAINLAVEAAAQYGLSFTAGEVTGEALPFMVQMAISPIAGVGKGLASQVARAAMKTVFKNVGNKVARLALKHLTKLATNVGLTTAKGMAMTLEPAQIAGTLARAKEFEIGDMQYEYDENGNAVYSGRDNMMTPAEAFAKSVVVGGVENGTELMGAASFDTALAVAGRGAKKVFKKFTPGFLDDMVSRCSLLPKDKFTLATKNVSAFREKVALDSGLGELMEELDGSIMNYIMGTDDTPLFDYVDENGELHHGPLSFSGMLDTYLTLLPMQIAFGVGSIAEYGKTKYDANRAVNKQNKNGQNLFGERWEEMKQKIENIGMDSFGADFADIVNGDNSLTRQQKEAMAGYALALQYQRGLDMRSNMEKAQSLATTIADNSFDQGYEMTSDEDRQDAQYIFEHDVMAINDLMGSDVSPYINLSKFLTSPIEALDELHDNFDAIAKKMANERGMNIEDAKAELRGAMTKMDHYLTSGRVVNGIQQRVQDDFQKNIDDYNQTIDSRTHSDGNIHSAVTLDGKTVYVTSGDVENTDGSNAVMTIDEEGNTAMMGTSSLSFNNVESATALKDANAKEVEAAMQSYVGHTIMRQFDPLNVGDSFEYTNENGEKMNVTVIDQQDNYMRVTDEAGNTFAVPNDIREQQLDNSRAQQKIDERDGAAGSTTQSQNTDNEPSAEDQTQQEPTGGIGVGYDGNTFEPSDDLKNWLENGEPATLSDGSTIERDATLDEVAEDGMQMYGVVISHPNGIVTNQALTAPAIDSMMHPNGTPQQIEAQQKAEEEARKAAEEQAKTEEEARKQAEEQRKAQEEAERKAQEQKQKQDAADAAAKEKAQEKLHRTLTAMVNGIADMEDADVMRARIEKELADGNITADQAFMLNSALKKAIKKLAVEISEPVVDEADKTNESNESDETDETNGETQGEVPDFVNDKAENARERGYRMVNGVRVDRQEPLETIDGAETDIAFSTKDNVNGKYVLVPMGSVIPSHVSGARNPRFFISEAQPKERTDKASSVSAQLLANNFDPERATSGKEAYVGTPVVNTRGEVIQGNNRTTAYGLMNADKRAEYKQYLADNAEKFGLTREQVESMENPMLVRMVDVSDNEAIRLGQMNAADNESGGKRRIEPQQTMQKLGVHTNRFFQMLFDNGGDEGMSLSELISTNGADVLRFMNKMGAIDNTQLQTSLDEKGNLTKEGREDLKKIVESSILEGGNDALAAKYDALPDRVKKALAQTMFRDEQVADDVKLKKYVQEAIELFYEATVNGNLKSAKTEQEALIELTNANNQDNLFGGAANYSIFAIQIAAKMQTETQKKLAQRLTEYYDAVSEDGGLFGGEPKGRNEAFAESFDVDINKLNTESNGTNENRESSTGDVVEDNRQESPERGRGGEEGATGYERAADEGGTPDNGGGTDSLGSQEQEVGEEPNTAESSEETEGTVEEEPKSAEEPNVDVETEVRQKLTKLSEAEASSISAEEVEGLERKLDEYYETAKKWHPVHIEKWIKYYRNGRSLSKLWNIQSKHVLAILENEVARRNAYAYEMSIENKQMSVDDTLDLFLKFNSNPRLTELARLVFNVTRKFKPTIKMTRQLTTGAYGNSGADGIIKYNYGFFANPNHSDQKKAEVILHELIHNAVQNAMYAYERKGQDSKAWDMLDEGQKAAVKKIFDIYKEIRKHPEAFRDVEGDGNGSVAYGLTDAHEMVAEMATESFVEQCKKLGLWTALKNAIKQFFGIETEGATKSNANDEIREALDYLLEHPNVAEYNYIKGKGSRSRMVSHDMLVGMEGFKNTGDVSNILSKRWFRLIARILDSRGKDMLSIKQLTGWEKSRDGEWKYELEDAYNILEQLPLNNTNELEQIANDKDDYRSEIAQKILNVKTGKSTEEIVNFLDLLTEDDASIELLKMYPILRNAKATITNDTLSDDLGSYNRSTNTFYFNIGSKKFYADKTFAHEIQHAVQSFEGFARGTNPDAINKINGGDIYAGKSVSEWGDIYNGLFQIVALYNRNPSGNFIDVLNQYASLRTNGVLNGQQLLQALAMYSPIGIYLRYAGEVEARQVEERLSFSEEKRRNTLADQQRLDDGIFGNLSIAPSVVDKKAKIKSKYMPVNIEFDEDGNMSMSIDTEYNPSAINLNGEEYDVAELEQNLREDVEAKLEESGFDGVTVKGVKLIGSRINGNEREDSDLDLLVEFEGDASEDALFNSLNEDGLVVNGVKVDVNPITRGKSGTIEQFMKRNEGFKKDGNIRFRRRTTALNSDNYMERMYEESKRWIEDRAEPRNEAKDLIKFNEEGFPVNRHPMDFRGFSGIYPAFDFDTVLGYDAMHNPVTALKYYKTFNKGMQEVLDNWIARCEELKQDADKFAQNELDKEIANAEYAKQYYQRLANGDKSVQEEPRPRFMLTENNESRPSRPNTSDNSSTEERDKRSAVWETAKKLGSVVHAVTSLDSIPNDQARKAMEDGRAVAYYDVRTGEVYVYLPNVANVNDAKMSVLHEVLGHKGLRELIGAERYDEELKRLYRSFDAKSKEEINRKMAELMRENNAKPSERGSYLAEAIDEWLAEREEAGIPELGTWQKIKAWVKDMLRNLGINVEINDLDVNYMLWRSYETLKNGGRTTIASAARDAIMRARFVINEKLNAYDPIQEMLGEIREARVWHGSGAEFDKFDHKFMGTGEGSQAYGFGTYVSEVEGIARTYADIAATAPNNTIMIDGEPINTKKSDAESLISGAIKRQGYSVEDAIEELKFRYDTEDAPSNSDSREKRAAREAVKMLESGRVSVDREKNLNLYEVEIPDDNGENYIPWEDVVTKKQQDMIEQKLYEKSLEMEPEAFDTEAAREALKRDVHDSIRFGSLTGKSLYGTIQYFLGADAEGASKFLNECGFVGFKVPTNNLREGDKSNNNYVIFNENDAQIKSHVRFKRKPSASQAPSNNAAADMYNRNSATKMADRIYKTSRRNLVNMFDESYHDNLRAIFELQQAILAETGVKLTDGTNIYLQMQRLSSVNQRESDDVMRNLIQPTLDFVADFQKKHNTSEEEMETYLIAKHGIERNEMLSRRDAEHAASEKYDSLIQDAIDNGDAALEAQLKADKQAYYNSQYQAFRDTDYSGLTQTFHEAGDPDDISIAELEQRANEFAADYEARIGQEDIDELWKHIHALSEYALKKGKDSGILSIKEYNNLKNRFQWYVPFRGWADEEAEDEWEYIKQGEGMTGDLLNTKANGRKSRPEKILQTLESIVHNTMMVGNKNKAKLALLRLAEKTNTSLLTASGLWYVRQGSGVGAMWAEQSLPDVADPALFNGAFAGKSYTNKNLSQMTEEERVEYMNDFENAMKDMQKHGDARQSNEGLNLGMPATAAQKKEHLVTVKRAGKTYTLNINSAPNAAQAINGLLNVVGSGLNSRIGRWLAKIHTSLQPLFAIRNIMRDVISSTNLSWIKYGTGYTARLYKNIARVFPATSLLIGKGGIWSLYRRYNNGKLDENIPIEKMFKEFMENGGETGYTQVYKTEDFDKMFNKVVVGKSKLGKAEKSVIFPARKLYEGIRHFNEIFENTTRFAVYLTSRQRGRTVLQSISDAKEASTNFNKKGSGAWKNKYMRDNFVFFNAQIQGMMRYVDIIRQGDDLNYGYNDGQKRHLRARLLADAAIWAGFGMAMYYLNFVLGSAGGDDDDEELDNRYLRMSRYKRKKNLLIDTGNTYIPIALGQEEAVMYGIGQILMENMMGHGKGAGEAAFEITEDVLSVLLPEVYPEVTTWGRRDNAVLDYVVVPILGLLTGTKGKIGIDLIRNKDFMGNPIVWDNKYEDVPAYREGNANTPSYMKELSKMMYVNLGWDINPSQMNYVAENTLGGILKFPMSLYNTFKYYSQDKDSQSEDDQVSIDQTIFGGFSASADQEWQKMRLTKEYYKWYKYDVDEVEQTISDAEKNRKEGNTEAADKELERLEGTTEKAYWDIWQRFEKNWNKAVRDKDQQKKDAIMREVVKEWRKYDREH